MPDMSKRLQRQAKRIQEENQHYGGGPLPDFEKVGRHTFQTLLAAGLLPTHKLLDFGCGSLRNGFWLMRFMDEGNYYGLEPVEKGVRGGLQHLIGPELEEFKKPTFRFSNDCDMGAFGVPFDYVVARSILSHACPGLLHKMLESFARSSPDGTFFVSYWRHDAPEVPPPPGSKENPHPTRPRWQFWKPYPFPLSPIPPEIERYRNMSIRPERLKEGIEFAVGDDLPDDDMRFIHVITYSLGKIQDIAATYGLSAEEDWTFTPLNRQIWLKIKRAE